MIRDPRPEMVRELVAGPPYLSLYVLAKHGGAGGLLPLLLIKLVGTGNELLDSLRGHTQAVRTKVINQEIKASLPSFQ